MACSHTQNLVTYRVRKDWVKGYPSQDGKNKLVSQTTPRWTEILAHTTLKINTV